MDDDESNYLSVLVEQHPDVIDFGDHVYGLKYGRDEYPDEVKVGMWVSHLDSEGRKCCSAVQFDVPEAEDLKGPRWQVQNWYPLTLSPSIRCSCGHHGFVRNGRWENC